MQYIGIQTQQSRNNFRSLLLLLLFPCLVIGLTYLFCFLLHLLAYKDDSMDTGLLMDYSTSMFVHLIPYVIGGVLIWFLIAYFANTSIINSAKLLEKILNSNSFTFKSAAFTSVSLAYC